MYRTENTRFYCLFQLLTSQDFLRCRLPLRQGMLAARKTAGNEPKFHPEGIDHQRGAELSTTRNVVLWLLLIDRVTTIG
jgi:hypothetical protein